MITWVYKKMSSLPAVFIDGYLYFMIAILGALEAAMASKEVYEYMNSHVVFYTKFFSGIFIAGVSSIKMFRSSSYSDHQKAKADAQAIITSKATETTTTVKETQPSIPNEKTNV